MKMVSKKSYVSLNKGSLNIFGGLFFVIAIAVLFNFGHAEGVSTDFQNLFSIASYATSDEGGSDDGGSSDEGGSDDGGNGGEEEDIPPDEGGPDLVAPVCTLSLSPSALAEGESWATLSWVSHDAYSGSINQGVGNVSPVSSGSVSVQAFNTTTYTATFYGDGGSVTCSTKIIVSPPPPEAPVCTLTANPFNINTGGSAALSWTSSNATTASIDEGIGAVSPVSGGSVTVSPAVTTSYHATFTGPGGTVDCQRTVEVTPPPPPPEAPVCTLTALPGYINKGDSSTLSWTTSNATSFSINQSIGSVSPVASGSKSVSPTVTTTYTGTANGPGGAVTCEATIKVKIPHPPKVPVCTLEAHPYSIQKNDSATLTWTSSNATSGSIDNGIGNITPVAGGSVTVSPTSSTYYTATFTGPNGTVECMAKVKVAIPPPKVPVCTLTANPTYIHKGNSATLTWTSENVTSGSIDNSVGSITPVAGGSVSVSPNETTYYTATFTGSHGSVECMAKVKVKTTSPPPPDAPTCTLSTNPTSVASGGTTSLSWTSSNTTSGTIDEGIGNISPVGGGSVNVTASTTTSYKATFVGPGGVVDCHATVTVTPPPPPTIPACTMTFSKGQISRGDSATLSWTGTNVTSVTIDNGIGATTTVNSSFIVSPSVNATYTGAFTGPNGNVTCQASITVTTGGGGCSGQCGHGQQPPNVVLFQHPVSQPLAAVYLSQIPYTGFSAGPITTAIYWTLLALWSALVAYFMVYRGFWQKAVPAATPIKVASRLSDREVEEDELYEQDARSLSTLAAPSYANLPFNLPIAENIEPIVETEPILQPANPLEKMVERRLSEDQILISKFGMERLATAAIGETALTSLLEKVSYKARRNYPREDGWIALSDGRVEEVLATALPAGAVVSLAKANVPLHADTPLHPGAHTSATPAAFVSSILAGEKDKVFATLRSIVSSGKGVDALMLDAVLTLDRVYRARIESAPNADEMLKAKTSHFSTKDLEELVRILSASIDETYSSSLTAAKLALANALAFTSKFKK